MRAGARLRADREDSETTCQHKKKRKAQPYTRTHTCKCTTRHTRARVCARTHTHTLTHMHTNTQLRLRGCIVTGTGTKQLSAFCHVKPRRNTPDRKQRPRHRGGLLPLSHTHSLYYFVLQWWKEVCTSQRFLPLIISALARDCQQCKKKKKKKKKIAARFSSSQTSENAPHSRAARQGAFKRMNFNLIWQEWIGKSFLYE